MNIILLQEGNDFKINLFKNYESIINLNAKQRAIANLVKHKVKNNLRDENSRIVGAHSGNGNLMERKENMVQNFRKISRNLIIAGVFNCVLDSKDEKGNENFR